jgi:hypothetical protein
MSHDDKPNGPCQHHRLTWDILYGKGFCLDCDAKIRAWHGEWSDYAYRSAERAIFSADQLLQLAEDLDDIAILNPQNILDLLRAKAAKIRKHIANAPRSATRATDPDVQRVLKILGTYAENAADRKLNGHNGWIPLEDCHLEVLLRMASTEQGAKHG